MVERASEACRWGERRDASSSRELRGRALTPQELQIALQVAEGKTNKEVGVGELNSRAELIRRFASEATTTVSTV
jgi:DNA-binding NarL/FixJ family response regulator